MTLDTFAPLEGHRFRLLAPGSDAIDLVLSSVTKLGGAASQTTSAGRGRVPFSLLFHAPGRELVPQRTYRLQHAGLGEFELFLVPLGPDGGGMQYEAIFT